MRDEPDDEPDDEQGDEYVAMLVDFAGTLRDDGINVGSGDVLTYTQAVATLDPTDLMDLYWAGRTTLVGRRDHVPDLPPGLRALLPRRPAREQGEREVHAASNGPWAAPTSTCPRPRQCGEERDQLQTKLGLVASGARTMRRKDFGACTPEELAALRRILRTMRLTPPRRRSRRTRPARSGRSLDVRRTVRETMRLHGEPAQLLRRERRLRHRPLTLILDVSGSMADYSRNLVQFAHTSTRTSSRVEVFCFGTRLTRITRELDRRRPDEALDLAAEAVLDWDGGTQIGASLDRFVRDHARHGMCRGGIVVICSDGLDRGDPDVLSAAMERLSRLCHRIIWLNPHKGSAKEFVPTTLGMMVAAPYVDELLSGHDLASLEEFATTLTRMR